MSPSESSDVKTINWTSQRPALVSFVVLNSVVPTYRGELSERQEDWSIAVMTFSRRQLASITFQ